MKHRFHLIDLIASKKVSSLFAGNYKTSFQGSGIEFSGIREYGLGDNAADIDWKASARTGKTYIKKYEEDRERKALFLVDTGSSMRFGSGQKTKEDTLREAFSLLLFSSAQNNDPSGAWFFADRIGKMHRIEKGMGHVQRIRQDFEDALAQSHRAESSSETVVEAIGKKRIRNHLIFIFSDSTDMLDESRFRAIAAQNDCIFIHIFDTFENTLAGRGVHAVSSGGDLFIDGFDTGRRERYVQERALKLESFRHSITKLGGSYLLLDESKNVYRELYLFFKKRQNNGL